MSRLDDQILALSRRTDVDPASLRDLVPALILSAVPTIEAKDLPPSMQLAIAALAARAGVHETDDASVIRDKVAAWFLAHPLDAKLLAALTALGESEASVEAMPRSTAAKVGVEPLARAVPTQPADPARSGALGYFNAKKID